MERQIYDRWTDLLGERKRQKYREIHTYKQGERERQIYRWTDMPAGREVETDTTDGQTCQQGERGRQIYGRTDRAAGGDI